MCRSLLASAQFTAADFDRPAPKPHLIDSLFSSPKPAVQAAAQAAPARPVAPVPPPASFASSSPNDDEFGNFTSSAHPVAAAPVPMHPAAALAPAAASVPTPAMLQPPSPAAGQMPIDDFSDFTAAAPAAQKTDISQLMMQSLTNVQAGSIAQPSKVRGWGQGGPWNQARTSLTGDTAWFGTPLRGQAVFAETKKGACPTIPMFDDLNCYSMTHYPIARCAFRAAEPSKPTSAFSMRLSQTVVKHQDSKQAANWAALSDDIFAEARPEGPPASQPELAPAPASAAIAIPPFGAPGFPGGPSPMPQPTAPGATQVGMVASQPGFGTTPGFAAPPGFASPPGPPDFGSMRGQPAFAPPPAHAGFASPPGQLSVGPQPGPPGFAPPPGQAGFGSPSGVPPSQPAFGAPPGQPGFGMPPAQAPAPTLVAPPSTAAPWAHTPAPQLQVDDDFDDFAAAPPPTTDFTPAFNAAPSSATLKFQPPPAPAPVAPPPLKVPELTPAAALAPEPEAEPQAEPPTPTRSRMRRRGSSPNRGDRVLQPISGLVEPQATATGPSWDSAALTVSKAADDDFGSFASSTAAAAPGPRGATTTPVLDLFAATTAATTTSTPAAAAPKPAPKLDHFGALAPATAAVMGPPPASAALGAVAMAPAAAPEQAVDDDPYAALRSLAVEPAAPAPSSAPADDFSEFAAPAPAPPALASPAAPAAASDDFDDFVAPAPVASAVAAARIASASVSAPAVTVTAANDDDFGDFGEFESTAQAASGDADTGDCKSAITS